MRWREMLGALLLATTSWAAAADAPVDAAALYATHCATCHGTQRLGGMGPALLPQSLERLRQVDAQKVIHAGRPATQMPAFGDTLQPAQIAALAAWIYAPVEPAPEWRDADIRASRSFTAESVQWPARPRWKPRPQARRSETSVDQQASGVDIRRWRPVDHGASRSDCLASSPCLPSRFPLLDCLALDCLSC